MPNGNGGSSPYAVIVFLFVVALIAVFLILKYAWGIILIMTVFMWFDCFAPAISTIKRKILVTLIAAIPFFISVSFALSYPKH